jgi:hypothetical protein
LSGGKTSPSEELPSDNETPRRAGQLSNFSVSSSSFVGLIIRATSAQFEYRQRTSSSLPCCATETEKSSSTTTPIELRFCNCRATMDNGLAFPILSLIRTKAFAGEKSTRTAKERRKAEGKEQHDCAFVASSIMANAHISLVRSRLPFAPHFAGAEREERVEPDTLTMAFSLGSPAGRFLR